jgi:hypothetical protein
MTPATLLDAVAPDSREAASPQARMRALSRCLAILCVLLALAPRALAQCDGTWLPTGLGAPGVDGTVGATLNWDPDGPGPSPPILIVGGYFTRAGGTTANNIAAWDGNAWTALGAGVNGAVTSLAVLPSGDLVAGGSFTTAAGITVNGIARWNGVGWSPIGAGMRRGAYDATVSALAVLPNGDLVAGGNFDSVGGSPIYAIARWDGRTWSALGAGFQYGSVNALAVLHNGDLIAGGYFMTDRIARWNGTSWSFLGSGITSAGQVYSLAVLPSGDLIVGGNFTGAGGVSVSNIARWNGAAWSALGAGTDLSVDALAVLPNGDLLVGGDFNHAGGAVANYIARWNGSSWSTFGTGMSYRTVNSITVLPSGDFVAGGGFNSAGGSIVNAISRWNGSAWVALGAGLTEIHSLTMLPGGAIVAGGSFVGQTPAYAVAVLNGSTWNPLGTGIDNYIAALAVLPSGDLVAAGAFTIAGGVAVNHIARWSAGAWSPLGSGMNDTVTSLALLPNGDLVAGGYFTTAGGAPANDIARWDGRTWSPLGAGMANGGPTGVRALAVLPSGDLIAGGGFTSAGGIPANNIALWNGSTWSALGTGTSYGAGGDPRPSSLAVLPNGDLIVGGAFGAAGGIPANHIARWNGASWSALGSGTGTGAYDYPDALAVLPNGDLIVAGQFATAGGIPASNIVRWRGGVWSAMGPGANSLVEALLVDPSGDVFAGGLFTNAGANGSAYFARWSPPASPTISAQPTPVVTCSGSASFSVSAPGSPTYRWQRETSPASNIFTALADGPIPRGSIISGSGSATLSIVGLTSADARRYRCAVSNACQTTPSNAAGLTVNSADFNGDGSLGTDADIEAFFTCLAGACCPTCGSPDFDADGNVGTSDDIEAFFSVLSGRPC